MSKKTSEVNLHASVAVQDLEEIDEKEESSRLVVEDVDGTPMKLRGLGELGAHHGLNSALRSSRDSAFRSSFIDAHLISHRDNYCDDTSS